jgi:hypothetical protein
MWQEIGAKRGRPCTLLRWASTQALEGQWEPPVCRARHRQARQIRQRQVGRLTNRRGADGGQGVRPIRNTQGTGEPCTGAPRPAGPGKGSALWERRKQSHMRSREAEQHVQAVLAGIANRARIDKRHRLPFVDLPRAEVAKEHSEEPGAGKLHAGICAGGARQRASLPRCM